MKLLDNQTYYFKTGSGRWQGSFTFKMTSWKRFWHARLSLKNRFLFVSMYALQRMFGSSTIYSELRPFVNCSVAGVSTNVVVIKKFGIVVYVLREQYVLHPDGHQVSVHSKERFGPIPFLFRTTKRHPAEVLDGGCRTRYYNMPILGAIWEGNYVVQDADHIDARLICDWAESREVIARQPSRQMVWSAEIVGNQPLRDLTAVAMRLYEYRDRYESVRDRRAVFAHAYARITTAFNRELERAGFADRVWIVKLDIAFAQQFFNAHDAYDLTGKPPPGWSHVFAAPDEDRTSVLEELLVSMTAHIVHDLPLALNSIGVGGSDGGKAVLDFQLANDLLQAGIDDIQTIVAERYNPWLRWLDQFARRDDEVFTNYGIRASRAVAWYNAERLAHSQVQEEAFASIAKSCDVAVKLILEPPWWSLRLLLRLLRWVSAVGRVWPEYRPAQ